MQNQIPNNWQKVNLGDVAKPIQGLAINSKTNYLITDGRGLPLLRITDLFNNTESIYIDSEKVSRQCIVNPEDILYSRTGQVGFVFTGRKGVLHNNCFKVEPNDLVDKNFLYWFLRQKSVKHYIDSVVSGSAQPDLPHPAFKSIPLLLPSLTEQKRIASILNSFEKKIEVNNKIVKTLEEMAQAIFKGWYVKSGILENQSLISISDIAKGKKPNRILSSKAKGSIEYLLIDSLSGGQRIYTDDLAIPTAEEDEPIVVMDGASSGRVFVGRSGAVGSTLSVIKTKDEYKYLKMYVLYLLKNMQPMLMSHLTGSAIPHVDKNFLLSYSVKVPNEKLAKKFDLVITPIFNKSKQVEKGNQKLAALRDLLLPKLMKGEVRI